MNDKISKNIYKFSRFCIRCFSSRYRVCLSEKNINDTGIPVVYVVHHQNLRGPILSIAWLNIPVHLWVLSVFSDQRTCFRQFYDYTFTQRRGIPKGLAAVIAYPVSVWVSGIMQGMNAIPVFRGSRAIAKTFNQSLKALINGENLLICPDIDYTDPGPHMGEMYDGFLDLERYYIKRTGHHLAFIPLYISKREHCIYEGKAVYFHTVGDFKNEKKNVYDRLMQEFSRLENRYGSGLMS
ncbi:glycerol acyltransferase [Desulfitobacterium metallireducens DSM 15288]|uniref:Glycerol acyltransferase n=2 Tax=Desulfitobacterium TaxID=36853 RepID=W0EAC4_9FIRM|nr:glycerol acyltransferase [Desulfitobacterium metallireducens DSM 15288]